MDSDDGRCRACTGRCKTAEDIIWRTAERELMRSISESRKFGMDDENNYLHFRWRIRKAHRQSEEKLNIYISGGDALRGHTRSHPEHDG